MPTKKSELYYVLVENGGCELNKLGPFKTDEERDRAARKTWNDADFNTETSNIYWLNVDTERLDDPVSVGEYSNADTEPQEGDDDESDDAEDREEQAAGDR